MIEQDSAKLAFLLNLFAQQRTRRNNFEGQWEESALMAWPEYSGSFFFGRDIAPGAKRAYYQVDSTASLYSFRFGAINEWLITPSNMLWSKVEDDDPYLMKDPTIKLWYHQVTTALWKERYKATANFIGQNQQNMQGLGVFGNMGMFVDELDNYLDPGERGLRYLGLPVGEIYVETDHQRRVVGFTRHFRLNAQQHKTRWPDQQIPIIEAALKISSQQLFNILHFVRPRTDYHPDFMLAPRGKKYESIYVNFDAYCILEEGGYRTLPLAYGRYMVAPDEDYGRGPTQAGLATLKTRNAQKRVFLKQGHRAGDPTWLVPETGLFDLAASAGKTVAGGMTADGKPLVGILPTGQIQITKEMMDVDDVLLRGFYLIDLFQMILGDKQNEMSPRQVLEYVNERGVILGPTVGGLLPQYCAPLIDRELDLLSWLRKLPKMPPAMREARAQAKIVYTSPIARAMQAQESAGYVRSFEFAGQAVQAGADPSILDIFELDEALPAMAERDNAPPEWFSSPKSLAAKRKGRQQQQQADQQAKELPGRAAIIKAQAIQAKAQTGGNIGGTLSGVPPQQMPNIPNAQGQATNNPGLGGP